MPKFLRIAILTVAIFATLGVSLAAVSHIDSSPNGCNLCFVAHTVAFETPAAQPLFAPEVVRCVTLVSSMSGYQPCAGRCSDSRGPPRFL
jgi:hypothetical protein